MQKYYAAIDLKSFYASVECVERELDPLTTNLVVADFTRTDKTICLAVSPSLKQLGLPGRCRLFEVKEKAREYEQKTGKKLEYIIAPPRMKTYLAYSKKIYKSCYLNSVSADDIFIYSIDEVFIDITSYLKYAKKSPLDFAREIVNQIYTKTGLTATAGVGTNLYLAKIAMDILAKHAQPDSNNCRIAFLDEKRYKEKLWTHTPLTDFWSIGPKTAKKLSSFNLFTMGDLARVALKDEEFYFKIFGKNAELLIDHIWGLEPVSISDIKSYTPKTTSLSTGQVLASPTPLKTARLLVLEMADTLALELVSKNLTTNIITLDLSYSKESSKSKSHGSIHPAKAQNTSQYTSSLKQIVSSTLKLFDRIADKNSYIKHINLVFGNTVSLANIPTQSQLSLFKQEYKDDERQASLSKAIIEIQTRFGKNSISKAISFEEGANQRRRNLEIGGHHG